MKYRSEATCFVIGYAETGPHTRSEINPVRFGCVAFCIASPPQAATTKACAAKSERAGRDSPPYYGRRTYIPDQWLRNWFLGGSSNVEYSNDLQLAHGRHHGSKGEST
jgi:hypothetical protein